MIELLTYIAIHSVCGGMEMAHQIDATFVFKAEGFLVISKYL